MSYTKQNFQDGKVLTATNLNLIEDGIVAVYEELDKKSDTGHAHSNYASEVKVTGSGNAITSITQNGNVITANKNGTFLTNETPLSKGTDTSSTEVKLSYGDSFIAMTDTVVDGHKITDHNTTFTLPNETGLSVDQQTEPDKSLLPGTKITFITSIEKGDSSHNIDVTKASYTLPQETTLTKGAVTGEGNAVTDILVDDHTITIVKENNFSEAGHTHTLEEITDFPEFMEPSAHAHLDSGVVLEAPYTFTKDFGYYTLGSSTSKQYGTTGQTLRSFLEGAFAQEDKTIFSTTPSCEISMSGGSYEVGTTITPAATWSINVGEYKWGTCGTVASAASANYGTKTTGISYTNGTISYDKTGFALTASTTVTASGSSTRSAVTNRPCSNLGNDIYSYLDDEYKSSKALSPTKSVTFTPYRSFFYGAVTVAPTQANLTSAVIRGLTNGGNYDKSKTFTIKANGATNLKAFIVAIPSNNTRGRISSVKSTAGMTVDMTDSYKTKAAFTVDVADARGGNNNTASYDVYIWAPASIDSGTVHEFVLA